MACRMLVYVRKDESTSQMTISYLMEEKEGNCPLFKCLEMSEPYSRFIWCVMLIICLCSYAPRLWLHEPIARGVQVLPVALLLG
jgi:hypothetical protein